MKIKILIEEFNKMESCVKLKLESGGIARIVPSDPMILEDSRIVLSDKFFDEIQRISKMLNTYVIINSLQTTVRIEEEETK